MRRPSEYTARLMAFDLAGILLESPPERRLQHACHSCEDTLTAKQPDGRYGCFYHYGPLQLAVVA